MGPDLTWAYFKHTVNKRPTRLWPNPKGKKLKNFGFLGEIFKIQTQTKDGWPDSTTKNWNDPGQKNFARTHHYQGLAGVLWFQDPHPDLIPTRPKWPPLSKI